MNQKKILTLIMVILFCFGFSLFEKTKWVWHKGEYDYVRLAKPDKGIENLQHPAELSPELVEQIIAAIRYTRPFVNLGGLSKGKDYELLTAEEAGSIAPYISQAFAQANSSQWVDFSLEVHRGVLFIFGSDQLTDGVAFMKDGKLNIAFRNISEKISAEGTPNIVSPLKSSAGTAKLVPGKGLELAKNKKGKTVDNWLVIDLKAFSAPAAEAKPAEVKAEPAKPETKPAEVKPQEKSPEKSAAQPAPPPAEPKSGKSVKQRLTELRELYDQGLITEDDYNKKREDILKDL